jgi:hypothetical protein
MAVQEISFSSFFFWVGLTAVGVGGYMWYDATQKWKRGVGIGVTIGGLLCSLLAVSKVNAFVLGVSIPNVLGPLVLLASWAMVGYDIYLKKQLKKPAAALSTSDIALLDKAPAIRVEYTSGAEGKPGTLTLKNDRDSPAIIRQIGKLVSREEYESDYTLTVIPAVPPQVEKGNPVECKVYGVVSAGATSMSLENVLRRGSEHGIDSVLIDYDDCDGNQFSRLFHLIRNSDGSIVFTPNPVALRGRSVVATPTVQSLFSLRQELAIGQHAQTQMRRTESAQEADPPDGERIKITLPQQGEALIDKQPLGPASFSYIVRGQLKSLPEGHTIWLLTADERTEQYWPQGFETVQYNEQTGLWQGRIHAGNSPLRVVALVAPPTSQQLFRYFQKRGNETKIYAPLDRIPAECRNVTTVQTRLS